MAKPSNKKVEEVVEESTENTSVKNTERKTLKEVYVLDIDHRLLKEKVIKKGTRLAGNSTELYLVKQTDPAAIKVISRDMFEVTDDVVIKVAEIVKCGTILDPVKDKIIFDRLASVEGAIKKVKGA